MKITHPAASITVCLLVTDPQVAFLVIRLLFLPSVSVAPENSTDVGMLTCKSKGVHGKEGEHVCAFLDIPREDSKTSKVVL